MRPLALSSSSHPEAALFVFTGLTSNVLYHIHYTLCFKAMLPSFLC